MDPLFFFLFFVGILTRKIIHQHDKRLGLNLALQKTVWKRWQFFFPTMRVLWNKWVQRSQIYILTIPIYPIYNLQRTNISLGKRKFIFKHTLGGDMLVARRVYIQNLIYSVVCCFSFRTSHPQKYTTLFMSGQKEAFLTCWVDPRLRTSSIQHGSLPWSPSPATCLVGFPSHPKKSWKSSTIQ